jgi:mediator of RNA polymerase II transcription subunit 8
MLDAFQASLTEYVTVQVKKKYTVEEQAIGIENVRTGLRRDLEESDEEEDDEEDEEEVGAGPEAVAAQSGAGGLATGAAPPTSGTTKLPMQPEHLFWISVKGDLSLPRNVEFESQRKITQMTKRPAPPR